MSNPSVNTSKMTNKPYKPLPEAYRVALWSMLGSVAVGLAVLELAVVYFLAHVHYLGTRPSPILFGMIMAVLWCCFIVATGSGIYYFMTRPINRKRRAVL